MSASFALCRLLWKEHDVSQDLQAQSGALSDVDRSFVHVDQKFSHSPVRGMGISMPVYRNI